MHLQASTYSSSSSAARREEDPASGDRCWYILVWTLRNFWHAWWSALHLTLEICTFRLPPPLAMAAPPPRAGVRGTPPEDDAPAAPTAPSAPAAVAVVVDIPPAPALPPATAAEFLVVFLSLTSCLASCSCVLAREAASDHLPRSMSSMSSLGLV